MIRTIHHDIADATLARRADGRRRGAVARGLGGRVVIE